jgi:hypothetical protein
MASYHLHAKIGKKGKATAHASYIAREDRYSGHARYEDLEITASGNMPEWAANNPSYFWQASDEYERENGSVYREIEIALPREFTPEQRLHLVQEFVKNEIGDQHAYQFAIHKPKASLEKGDQPHAHIMYSERMRDGIQRDPEQYFKRYNSKNPEKGGAKKFSGGKHQSEMKAELINLRERWAKIQNKHLEKYQCTDRVDHRSLKDQGIDREPEKHLGSIGIKQLSLQEINALLARRAAEGELERAQREVSLIDVSGDLQKARQERDLKRQNENIKTEDSAVNKNSILEIDKHANEEKKPEYTASDLAKIMLKTLIEKERINWRKGEEIRLLKEAEKSMLKALEISHQEPKKPFFGLIETKKWKREFESWQWNFRREKNQHFEYKKQAQEAIDGKAPNEPWLYNKFYSAAYQRLENEYPRLDRALREEQQREEQQRIQAMEKAAKERAANQATAAFKTLATKRAGRFLGYGGNGGSWRSLPDGVKNSIDEFNKKTESEKKLILEKMGERFAKEPKSAETFLKMLVHEKERERDRGFSR